MEDKTDGMDSPCSPVPDGEMATKPDVLVSECFARELNSDTSSAPTSCVLVWFSLRNVMTDCTIVQQQES